MVRTPRLRSTGSSSVPLMGERPCMRGRTRSDAATPISGTISACGVPGTSGLGDRRVAMKRRAFWFEPRPSARRTAVVWTTGTPARRAAAARRAMAGTTGAAARASSGRSEWSPITPRWHSLATSAACGGTRSAARATATSSRPLEVEAGVEGVAARVVEAERAGAEDLHHERAGRLRAPEDEALGEIQPHVLHLAGDRVRERRELDLEG